MAPSGVGRAPQVDGRVIEPPLGHRDAAPHRLEPITAGQVHDERGMTATQAGFLLKQVEILQSVAPGDLLGRLVTVAGEPLEEYRAPVAGIVAMAREFPIVQAGDVLFLLAEAMPSI